MKKTGYVPDRGDAIWLNFNPRKGHEQAGLRPALVLSPISYNEKIGLALVCPITNQKKGYPFEVELPKAIERKVKGVVLSDQVKSLDWRERQADFIAEVPEEVVQAVWENIQALLDPETDA